MNTANMECLHASCSFAGSTWGLPVGEPTGTVASLAAGFSPEERFVIFACFATPSAAASYAMASGMGCDGELAGQFVVWGTALSILTLFLWIFFMGQAGILQPGS